MTATLSSEPRMTDSPPIEAGSPPRRQRSELAESARKRTQPSWASSHADRSVASGAASESPMNGRRRKVPRLAILSPTASATACWRTPRVMSRVGRVELVRADPRVDERAPAVHVLRALLEAPALPVVAARRLVRAVEPVREDRLAARRRRCRRSRRSARGSRRSRRRRRGGSGRPVSALTVAIVSAGPPIWFAALIFDVP